MQFDTSTRRRFLCASPVVDCHDAYPQLGPELLKVWPTHDTVSDFFKHLRSAAEIKAHLGQCGTHQIEAYYAGNGVEARARKPQKAPRQRPAA